MVYYSSSSSSGSSNGSSSSSNGNSSSYSNGEEISVAAGVAVVDTRSPDSFVRRVPRGSWGCLVGCPRGALSALRGSYRAGAPIGIPFRGSWGPK